MIHRKFSTCILILQIYLSFQKWFCESYIIPKHIIEWALKDFAYHESHRKNISSGGEDMRSMAPFLSSDSLRARFHHDCEPTKKCFINFTNTQPYDRYYIKTDYFPHFMKEIEPKLPAPYILMVGDGDNSVPDGQTDTIGYIPHTIASPQMYTAAGKGRLLRIYSLNLWWLERKELPRPWYLHCVPYGLQPRRCGEKDLNDIIYGLKNYIVEREPLPAENKTLLFLSFDPAWLKPDRQHAIDAVKNWPQGLVNISTRVTKRQWLESITTHKFILSPFGHALDTLRMTEILLFGGIPVTKNSTIGSCYDDTDNMHYSHYRHYQNPRIVHVDDDHFDHYHHHHHHHHEEGEYSLNSSSLNHFYDEFKRNFTDDPNYDSYATFRRIFRYSQGSLPVVIVKSWSDLTPAFLEKEYARITSLPRTHWDYSRIFAYHWIDRIFTD